MPKYLVKAQQSLTQIVEAPSETLAMEYTFSSGEWELEELEVLEAELIVSPL